MPCWCCLALAALAGTFVLLGFGIIYLLWYELLWQLKLVRRKFWRRQH